MSSVSKVSGQMEVLTTDGHRTWAFVSRVDDGDRVGPVRAMERPVGRLETVSGTSGWPPLMVALDGGGRGAAQPLVGVVLAIVFTERPDGSQ
ncbi:MAG: hypothetical protein M3R02_05465 [Chloroflexota bacterium]|nr:hypothetical protein [Chloroflexota bacterium]